MTIRRHPRGYLEHDIIVRLPNGAIHRERRSCPVQSMSAAVRWAEKRERHLALNGHEAPPAETPTLAAFAVRWTDEYSVANGNKPATLDAKERILRLHLLPVLKNVPVDAIGPAEVQRVKAALAANREKLGKKVSPKTVACVLSVLSTMLKAAEDWKVIARAPKIELPRVHQPEMSFYDFGEYRRLREAAAKLSPMHLAFALLSGDAGLRRGELVALEGSDVSGGEVVVRRNEWEGEVGTPKGGKLRRVPMTERLKAALVAVKHLRGKRLLWQASGDPVRVTTLQSWMETITTRAGLPASIDIHRLRHTFCSHLAMLGASPKAVQELAGHADLATTMRYMHLSPASKSAAIRLLESVPELGTGVEQGVGP